MKLRCWTGPCFVKQITDACKSAGLNAEAGTEHVLLQVDADDTHSAKEMVITALSKKHGTSFGLYPVRL